MTREDVEKRVLPLDWKDEPYSPHKRLSQVAKTGLEFNFRVVQRLCGCHTLLIKETPDGEFIEAMEVEHEWVAYDLARAMQIDKLCEILRIMEWEE